MKYNISIDQPRSIEWGLSHAEAFMFSFCYSLSSWATPIFIDGEVYYFASRNKAIEEMPLITDKPDTVYRLYKSLAEKGLIDFVKFDNKDCIKLTEKSKAWNSEKNPSVGKKSELLGKKSENDSEKNPTYNRTILDNKTTDTSETDLSKNEILVRNEKEFFDWFWKTYDKAINEHKTRMALSATDYDERLIILENLPKYIQSTPDKKYRVAPLRWIEGKRWNDEIIFENQPGEGMSSSDAETLREYNRWLNRIEDSKPKEVTRSYMIREASGEQLAILISEMKRELAQA